MKITNLKNIDENRIFSKIEPIKRLLKRNGYCLDFSCDNYFHGILMLSNKDGIRIRYANFTGDYPNERSIKPIKYTKETKTFKF